MKPARHDESQRKRDGSGEEHWIGSRNKRNVRVEQANYWESLSKQRKEREEREHPLCVRWFMLFDSQPSL